MEEANGRATANERSVQLARQQYDSWKRLLPYLYDWFENHALLWPSLSCRWGPVLDHSDQERFGIGQKVTKRSLDSNGRGGSFSMSKRGNERRALYLSEQTDGSAMNTLVMAYVDIPKNKTSGPLHTTGNIQGSSSVRVIKTIVHPGEVNKVMDVPHHPHVVVTHSDAPEVYVWNFNTQKDRSMDASRATNVSDAEASEADITLVGHTENAEFALGTSDAKAMVASGGKDMNVLVWNIEGSMGRGNISPDVVLGGHTNTVEDVTFKPSSWTELASVADDYSLMVWDTRSHDKGPAMCVTKAHGEKDVHCVDWSGLNSHLLVTGAQDGGVHVWDTRHMTTPVHVFNHHKEAVMNVEWSPHTTNVFATGSDDGIVCIWDLSRRHDSDSAAQLNVPVPDELVLQHAGHQSSVVDFCWNPDEPWTIMSASVDTSSGRGGGTLQLWRVSDLVYKSEDDIMKELEPWKDYIATGEERYLLKTQAS